MKEKARLHFGLFSGVAYMLLVLWTSPLANAGEAGARCDADRNCAQGLVCSQSGRCLPPLPFAAPAERKGAGDEERQVERYGLSVLGADLAVFALWGVADVETLPILLLPFSGAAVHAAYGEWGNAALSIGLRIGLAGIVAAVASHPKSEEDVTPYLIGMGGAALAMGIDYLLLARRPVPVRDARRAGNGAMPALTLTNGGAVLGVSGVF